MNEVYTLNQETTSEIIQMPITYKDIEEVNSSLSKTPIKGKDYIEVNQRIKAFRILHPEALIKTELIEFSETFCLIKAEIYDNQNNLIATGHALEEKQSSFINKTSFLENCETSAIGRALGIAGYGIDTSIASAEEVENAINNQLSTITLDSAKQLVFDKGKYAGKTYQEVLESDSKYLEWMLNNTKDEVIKKSLSLLLDKEILSDEDSDKKLKLLNELNELVLDNEKVEFEDVLKFYNVKSSKDLTLKQLEEAVNKMKKK